MAAIVPQGGEGVLPIADHQDSEQVRRPMV